MVSGEFLNWKTSIQAYRDKVTLSRTWILIFTVVFVLALVLRCRALGVDGLWMDEVFGASYVNLNIFEILVAVLRFDIHPPFYYLQLKLWSLPSSNDIWLLMNSVVWSMLTLLTTTYGVYRLAGSIAALIAAALVAVLGSEIHYAMELRMYSMISCVTVIGWILAEKWINNPDSKNTAWLLVVLGLLGGLHSISFIPVSSILLYAVVGRWQKSGLQGLLHSWTIIVGAGILLTPWLINASLRSTNHTLGSTADSITRTLSGWVLDSALPSIFHQVTAFVFIGFVIMTFAFGTRRVRNILLCFVVYPVLLLGVVSVVVRPIWVDRAVAFCAPFLAASAALMWQSVFDGSQDTSKRKQLSVGLICLFVVTVGVVGWNQAGLSRKMQYREAAQFISLNNQQQLPVYIPANVTFWGLARYLRGSNWGSLLGIQDPDKPDHSEIWARIYAYLGKAWLTRLHLLPSTRELATKSGTMYIGFSPLPNIIVSKGFYIVGDNSLLNKNTNGNCGAAHQEGLWRFRGVVILRCGATTKL
ncbi:MAG: hypothetical protein Q8N96_03145 [Methylovulum sp.]|nr:hypothetical protein [Methylovulum sp.]